MAQPRVHQRVGPRQRLPGFVKTAQVFKFLVSGKFETGMVFRPRRDFAQALRDEIEVVVGFAPAPQSGQRDRRAAIGRADLQAGLELGLGLGDAAVELQLDRAKKAEIGVVKAQCAGPVHQRQRIHVLAQPLVDVREGGERGCVARAHDRRVLHRGACSIGLAHLGQALGNPTHQVDIIGKRQRRDPGLLGGSTQPSLGEDDAGQQQARRHMRRRAGDQLLEARLCAHQVAGTDVLLPLLPERAQGRVCRRCAHALHRSAGRQLLDSGDSGKAVGEPAQQGESVVA